MYSILDLISEIILMQLFSLKTLTLHIIYCILLLCFPTPTVIATLVVTLSPTELLFPTLQ